MWIEVDQYVRHVLSYTCEMMEKVKEASNPKCSTPISVLHRLLNILLFLYITVITTCT
jgi:hypothetical protein